MSDPVPGLRPVRAGDQISAPCCGLRSLGEGGPLHLLRALRAYFYSGWAFLIPYFAACLLYWWLH
jgi:hypothetical protein